MLIDLLILTKEATKFMVICDGVDLHPKIIERIVIFCFIYLVKLLLALELILMLRVEY